MATDHPKIESRSRRLVAYIDHNKGRIIVDLAILAAWLLVASSIFGLLGLPNWLLYVVLFVGVVLFSRVTPTWERPYQSPD